MRNTRNYRRLALLLAVIMMIGIIPVSATAAGGGGSSSKPITNGSGNTYMYVAKDAGITFISGGKEVGGAADLDPNKASVLRVTVPNSTGLPQDKNGQIIVSVPAGFDINMASFNNDDVTATFYASTRQLVFVWKNEKKDGFSADLPITPDAPATREDISGIRPLIIRYDNNKVKYLVAVQPTLKVIDGVNRLTGVACQEYNGGIIANGTNLPSWKFVRKTGDWYSISISGKYLNYGKNGNHVSLTDTPQYFLYQKDGAGDQFIAFDDNGTKYYLNNKSKNVSKGIQASTYNDQAIEFHSIYEAPEGQGLVAFNINGGSVAASFDPVLAEAGSTFKLPDYTGKKNNTQFIGWAKVSNIYVAYGDRKDTYCEVYLPGTEYTVPNGETTLYAVFNEKGTKGRFGFRLDGKIVDEPRDNDAKDYRGHFVIENALKFGMWVVDVDPNKPVVGNHIENAVTANMNIIPSDEDIKATMPSYDPETMYVHWYVLKYSGQMWKIDGVIRKREGNAVAYQANIDGSLKGEIADFPNGYELNGKDKVIVGVEADGTEKTPSLDGYTFLGWSTEPEGTELYQTGEEITVTGSVNLYAQWKKIPKYEVSFSLTNASRETELPETSEYRAEEQLTLPQVEDRDGYIFSGWMVDGEKIDGDTFTVPATDVEITGTYYGPIDVDILSDWEAGEIGYSGAIITLTAVPHGPEGLEYTYQWQYLVNGEWIPMENATEKTLSYELKEETSSRTWRVVITDARPTGNNE